MLCCLPSDPKLLHASTDVEMSSYFVDANGKRRVFFGDGNIDNQGAVTQFL